MFHLCKSQRTRNAFSSVWPKSSISFCARNGLVWSVCHNLHTLLLSPLFLDILAFSKMQVCCFLPAILQLCNTGRTLVCSSDGNSWMPMIGGVLSMRLGAQKGLLSALIRWMPNRLWITKVVNAAHIGCNKLITTAYLINKEVDKHLVFTVNGEWPAISLRGQIAHRSKLGEM